MAAFFYPSAYAHVTQETVSNPAGRLGYHAFLKDNVHLTPIEQLFGTQAPKNLGAHEIREHVKTLVVRVHPDKNPRQTDLCHELFVMIKQAEQAALQSNSTNESDSLTVILAKELSTMQTLPAMFSSCREGSKDPIVHLSSLIENSQWLMAQDFLTFLKEHQVSMSEPLGLLASIVYFRLNAIPEAIEQMPPRFSKLKQLLAAYQSESEKGASQALDKAEEIKECYEAILVLPSTFHGNLDLLLSPHYPHLLIKNMSLDREEHIEYERHLRLAVRCCPDGLKEEKLALIEELKVRIHNIYPGFLHGDWGPRAEMAQHRRFFLEQFTRALTQQLPAQKNSESARERLGKEPLYFKYLPHLVNSLTHHDKIRLQNVLVSCLANQELSIEKELLPLLASLSQPSKMPLIGGFLDYSPATQQHLQNCIKHIKGFADYLKQDGSRPTNMQLIKLAALFSGIEDPIALSLVQLDLHEYSEALQSLQSISTDDDQLKQKIAHATFTAINVHDLRYIPENSRYQIIRAANRLYELDGRQLEAINTIMASG